MYEIGRDLVEIEGLLWPRYDVKARPYLVREQDLPKKITSHCGQKRVCVQAGGNVGYYVRMYAYMFEQVISFEPDPLNFYCLQKNITSSNVRAINACVGDSNDQLSLVRSKWNCGYVRVAGPGQIPTQRIDDLELEVCDLIHLDIEGYEYNALLGATSTMARCSPVVAFESKNLSENYGHSLNKIKDLMRSHGYAQVDEIYMDTVWSRR
jgi:FkbM family methyltransferase